VIAASPVSNGRLNKHPTRSSDEIMKTEIDKALLSRSSGA
jgi:hypothetical protein